jgi:hypothetical protein
MMMRAAAMQQQQQAVNNSHRVQSALLDPLADAVHHGSRQNLSDDEQGKLKKQIEFYFSPENLMKDMYLRSHMKEEGWTSIDLIKNFPRVRKFKASEKTIVDALNNSDVLEVDTATRLIRLKDAELRAKWKPVPGEALQSLTPKAGAKASAKKGAAKT